MNIYVVTNPESGWDCVKGVYEVESEEKLKEHLLIQQGYTEEPEGWEDNNIILLTSLITIT